MTNFQCKITTPSPVVAPLKTLPPMSVFESGRVFYMKLADTSLLTQPLNQIAVVQVAVGNILFFDENIIVTPHESKLVIN